MASRPAISPAARTLLTAGRQVDGATPPTVHVISLGISAYDMVWSVGELPAGGGKIRADTFHETGGGMAANAAVTAARLGGDVQFWGRTGNDRAGLAMVDALAAEGVGVAHFRRFDGAASSISGVIVDEQGERSIVNFRGANLPGDAAWLPLTDVAGADVVLVDPRWPNGAVELLKAARAASVPTVLDGDVADAAVFNQLLPWVDYAVFSEPGLAGYADTRQSDLQAQLAFARTQGCKFAAVTLGARGVAWLDDQGFHQIASAKVSVVDTTGAGDAFHGAVSFAIGAGLALRDALAFASAVAAIKCTHAGGRAGIPDLATTLKFLKQLEQTNE